MADWIPAGKRAPAFTLASDSGDKVSLAELKGRPVVLYFYPKDDTPGCTKEACAFRDRRAELQTLGAALLGVSPDTMESHARFRDKYQLTFPLLADPDHLVAEQYGAWREKNMYGKKSMGIQRSTYLIDADGKVAKVWQRVKVDGHDQEVIDALKALMAERAEDSMTVRDSATRPVQVILSAAKNLPAPPRSFAALRMTVRAQDDRSRSG